MKKTPDDSLSPKNKKQVELADIFRYNSNNESILFGAKVILNTSRIGNPALHLSGRQ